MPKFKPGSPALLGAHHGDRWRAETTGSQLLGNAAPPSLDGVSCHEGGPSGVLGFYVREGNRDAKIPSWNTRSREPRQGPRGPTSREGLAARIAGNSLLIAFAAGLLYFERLPQQPLRKEPERRLQYLGSRRSLLKAAKMASLMDGVQKSFDSVKVNQVANGRGVRGG